LPEPEELKTKELKEAALGIFRDALKAADARRAVLDAVGFDGTRLRVGDARFDLATHQLKIYSVAIGKAAVAMASALDERLGDRLVRGVISAPASNITLTKRWQAFEGGHPLPNAASLEAARAAFGLLHEADDARALVVFLVSGGGSAMLEWPRDGRVTLEDLREANRALVTCGASIAEVNAVRRALSSVKGGGLRRRAPRAAQVTLIVSDVGTGRDADVASGPTLQPPHDSPPVEEIVARHGLAARLPPSVTRALEESDSLQARDDEANDDADPQGVVRSHKVLLDNASACEAAAKSARGRGFAVELARDIADQPVEEGAALLVSRLAALYVREGAARSGVCLVSGGEFACPVRGGGRGGRSSETALRCAFEFERIKSEGEAEMPRRAVALCAGTDGVDGNSPAAGAVADDSTLERARSLGLDAARFLEESAAYTFFDRLEDAVLTGATGTNVRDLRILLAT
jgi:hydroxypyruvate reductase